jgi:hypothetical protein
VNPDLSPARVDANQLEVAILNLTINARDATPAQDVQAAINAASGQLPPTLPSPPIYRKTNPADTPVLMLALTSDTLPLTKVSDYANSILAQKISQMPGVGLVAIGGEQNPAIRVQVNPAQLAGLGLDLEAVRRKLTLVVDRNRCNSRGDRSELAQWYLDPAGRRRVYAAEGVGPELKAGFDFEGITNATVSKVDQGAAGAGDAFHLQGY